ncbi:YbdK family carboxylate-amine ligase [Entomohabitans teleogrylli]|uniref:YbdK family carboxylate-amine ligase n=1 Tax=Entomohabitans teleogrylli TaxID=1384589 RepID=UPI00073DAA3A|nr:YbdK family carboxylate-amine ligase [Entomohabitans teleogrylli]
MPLAEFHRSTPFTMGIELELQVIDPPGYNLSQDSSALIDAITPEITAGEVKHDITESMLEIATGVCNDIHQAASQFSAIQQRILHHTGRLNLLISGGGTHPFQTWQRQEISDDARYHRSLEMFGYLIRQATVFGQHVHIGCPDGDDAIYLMHGLARYVPHCIALAACSPWIQGHDTGFASSRLNIFSAFPDHGPAPWMNNWNDFSRVFRHLESTGMVESVKDLHWDIRPSPKFGTVEVRVMDTPLTLSHAINIAGFIQALSCWLLTEKPSKPCRDDYLLYPFNRFQACRYGLNGTLTDPRDGSQTTIGEDILRLLDKIAPAAAKLGADSALDELARFVRQPENVSDTLRAAVADGGSLSALVRKHCELWAAQ